MTNNAVKVEIDELDKKILQRLMKDANTSFVLIAKELNVSGGTIHVRMKKLVDSGVVSGSRLLINNSSLGFDICAFIGIYLEKGSAYETAQNQLGAISEIVELHYTTGIYNLFAKIICRDTRHLRTVLDEVQLIDGIQRTETFISLEESVHREIKLA